MCHYQETKLEILYANCQIELVIFFEKKRVRLQTDCVINLSRLFECKCFSVEYDNQYS